AWSAFSECQRAVVLGTHRQKLIKQVLGVHRTRTSLRMELNAAERFGFVPNAFVGAIVGVGKPRKPPARQRAFIDRKAMVLTRNEAAVGSMQNTRLVLAPVAIFQLVSLGSGGEGEDLVPQADSKDRLAPLEQLAHVRHRRSAHPRISRSIGNDDAVTSD